MDKNLDLVLDSLRSRHQSVAQYSVIMDEFTPSRRQTVFATGLAYEDALREKNRLQNVEDSAHPERCNRMSRTIYLMQLDNPDKCQNLFTEAECSAQRKPS